MYGKRFAAQEHAFELLCSPHDHTIGVIRQLCLADASAVQAVTPSDIYSWHPLAQRNAFGRRDVHQQSRLFARRNQGLIRSPNSNRVS